MRVLGIETSSPRGSVSLVEDDTECCTLTHRRDNAHGESIQPLIDQALARTGWGRGDIDRLAVGIGPGSFTGLRVGIALAQGIAEGLGVPLIGVVSLWAMARAVPPALAGLRCPIADARRSEVFAAAYDADGVEVVAPFAASPEVAVSRLLKLTGAPLLLTGHGCTLLPDAPGQVSEGISVHRSDETDLPNARWTADAARLRAPQQSVIPLYVRDDVAIRPNLPPNPLS